MSRARSTWSAIRRLASDMGVEIEKGFDVLYMQAPEGHVFSVSDTHGISTYHYGDDLPEAYADVKYQLLKGVRPCFDLQCEQCGPAQLAANSALSDSQRLAISRQEVTNAEKADKWFDSFK